MKNLMMLTIAALSLSATACENESAKINERLDRIEKRLDALARAGGGQRGPQRPEPDAKKTYAVPVDGDPFEGPADAKVTIVKAYDYACPFCDRVRDTMEKIKDKYGPQVRIVYKQFVVHQNVATTGALAFCAAAKQGKAMEMDKLLWDKSYKDHKFDADRCWESAEGCPIVDGYATELGLNVDQFKTDMKGTCTQLKDKDMKELGAFGVGATPSFFINGRYIAGAMPIDSFTTIIDEELKKADERIQQGTPAAEYYQQWVLDKGLKSLGG